MSTPVLYKNQLHHEIAKKVRRADFLTIELDPTKEIILLRMRPIGKDGYLVMEIPQSSTLLSFGLLLNDQIVALNGVPLDNLQALMNGLRKIGKEKSGSMLILRQNRLIKINLTAE